MLTSEAKLKLKVNYFCKRNVLNDPYWQQICQRLLFKRYPFPLWPCDFNFQPARLLTRDSGTQMGAGPFAEKGKILFLLYLVWNSNTHLSNSIGAKVVRTTFSMHHLKMFLPRGWWLAWAWLCFISATRSFYGTSICQANNETKSQFCKTLARKLLGKITALADLKTDTAFFAEAFVFTRWKLLYQ